MSEATRFFRAAGYVFTYSRTTKRATVRIEMWREDPVTFERFWVTVGACAPNRRAAYSAAMALVAWVRSLDVAPRATTKAQAVAECLAIMNDRLARARTAPGNPGIKRAIDVLVAGKAHAA